jgi:rod shape-determining protein MreD
MVALFLQTTFTTIPLILVVLNLNTIIYKRKDIFIYAFLFGFLFDVLNFKLIGLSSFLLILFLMFVLLYQRKFEIETSAFVAVSTFVGSLVYLFFMFLKPLFFESIAASLISVLIFKIIGKLNKYG